MAQVPEVQVQIQVKTRISGKDWKVERLTSCSRGARLSRDKQLTVKKTPMWYGATETWAAAGLLSLARRKTTSCSNGWLETMRRHV